MIHPSPRAYVDMTAALIIVGGSVVVGKLVVAQRGNSPVPDVKRH